MPSRNSGNERNVPLNVYRCNNEPARLKRCGMQVTAAKQNKCFMELRHNRRAHKIIIAANRSAGNNFTLQKIAASRT